MNMPTAARRVWPTWIREGDPVARARRFAWDLRVLEGHHVVRLDSKALQIDNVTHLFAFSDPDRCAAGLDLFTEAVYQPGRLFGDAYPSTIMVDLSIFDTMPEFWRMSLSVGLNDVLVLWPERWVSLVVFGDAPEHEDPVLVGLLGRLQIV